MGPMGCMTMAMTTALALAHVTMKITPRSDLAQSLFDLLCVQLLP